VSAGDGFSKYKRKVLGGLFLEEEPVQMLALETVGKEAKQRLLADSGDPSTRGVAAPNTGPLAMCRSLRAQMSPELEK
jgi:hypothetical protein